MDRNWMGSNALYLCGLLLAAALLAAPVVSLAQTDNGMQIDSVVPVTTSVAPTADAGPDQTVNQSTVVTFDGSASSDPEAGALNYTWTFVDGATNVTLYDVNPTYNFTNAGSFNVTLNVTDVEALSDLDYVTITVNDTEAPVANAGVDQNVGMGIAMAFNGSASADNVGIANYTWAFVDGGNVTLYDMSPAYTFNTMGVYNVLLTVADAAGNTDNDTVAITVTDKTAPLVTLTAWPDTPGAQNVAVLFNTTVTDNVNNATTVTYAWSVDGTVLTGEFAHNLTYTFADAGSYLVAVLVTDTAGNAKSVNMTYVVDDTVGPTGTLVGAPVGPVDQGTIVNFTATMTDNVTPVAYLTYEFFVDGTAVTSVNNTMSYNFTDAGTFTVRVEATDNATNVGFVELAFTVNDNTNPTVTVAGTPASPIDMGGWVNFTATAADNLSDVANITYQWYLDGAIQAGQTNVWFNHTFALPGTYDVMVEVEDEAGNTANDTIVYVIVDTIAPVANASADQAVDAGTAVAFDGSGSSDNVAIANYTWTFTYAAAETLYGVAPAFTFVTPGSYLVTLTVADAAGNEANDTLYVNVTDMTAPVANAGADQSVPQEAVLTFNGAGSFDVVGITNYTWTFVDGEIDLTLFANLTLFLTGTTNVTLYGVAPTYVFAGMGTYEVTLTVADAAGHTDTDNVTITVTDGIDPTADAGADVTGYLAPDEYVMHFDGSASDDNVMVANYTWTFVDGTKVIQVVNTTTNATENATVDNVVTLYGVFVNYAFDTAGAYDVTLTVADAAGNTGTDDLTVTVAADTTAPASSADAIATFWDDDGTITVTATASDAHSGVASVALYVATSTDDATYGAYAMVGTADTTAPYSWTYTAADGYFRFYTVATDVAGNVEVAPATADATAGYDSTDPTATITADKEKGETGITVAFTVTTADNLGAPTVAIVITDKDGAQVSTLTGAAPTYKFDKAGTYTVTVTATDAAGNVVTDDVEITVSAPEEESSLLWLWILIVVIIVVIVVVVVVVLMMGKKTPPAGETPAEGEQPPEQPAQ